MASINTRLNIEKLDGNIVQKHRGLKQVGLKQLGSKQVGFKQLGVKQVGFKQLGPGVKTGVHRVQDEKHVWFEVELQGAQENRKAEVIQESHDHAAVAERKLKVKQLKGKTNTDCLMGNAAERYSGDNNMVALGVVVVIEEYAHEPLTFRDAVAYEIISKWISVMTEDMDTRSNYMGFTCESMAEIWVIKGLLVEAKEVILGMEIFRTRSGNTPRVSQFWFSNEMSIQILLGGQSMMLLEGGLSGNHDKEKKKSFELRRRRAADQSQDATWHYSGGWKEDFDINSPLGEQVVDFLMENKDVAGLPRHLVKQLFSQLVNNLSSTKRMSDEPLGDDSKPRSYDVTFSNPLFDFNDDFTLCNDNPLFDEKFEDISSLDSPKSAPLNYEPLGNPDSVSRSLETSDLIVKELTAEIGLDDSILTKIDDGYYDSEGDIIFLEHLLIE
ncbi:hypothetical protein Tco_1086064 [Tanacetum coccineum]